MDKALLAGIAMVALWLLVRVGVSIIGLICMFIPVVLKLLETLALFEQVAPQVRRIIGYFHNLFRMIDAPPPVQHQLAPLDLPPRERFTLAEIRGVTNNFAQGHLIAESDYSRVYKAQLHDGRHVAVKRFKRGRRRSAGATFDKELSLLCPLRHENIIRLLGSCAEEEMRILVYEHMYHGTLRGLLDQASSPVASSWRMRLEVLLGAARGIRHLHYNAVIHGNVTSSNILLGRSFRPRLSGFGSSVPGTWSQPTDVFQTDGYADPEYQRTRVLRRRTDMYGLGVVMLEVLTGQEPVLDDGTMLVSWAVPWIVAGRLSDVVDERRAPAPTTILYSALCSVAATAARCLSMDGDRRPAIAQVVENLEEALMRIGTDE